eukprot:194751-Prorocentrum_minimum.AAC.3
MVSGRLGERLHATPSYERGEILRVVRWPLAVQITPACIVWLVYCARLGTPAVCRMRPEVVIAVGDAGLGCTDICPLNVFADFSVHFVWACLQS